MNFRTNDTYVYTHIHTIQYVCKININLSKEFIKIGLSKKLFQPGLPRLLMPEHCKTFLINGIIFLLTISLRSL